ncbi:FAD binding domain-containing protein [Colletotrichum karsti]|uniref:FAD binding domain-containing protein n=1 Tax=Colletotrichum karsti TaxID=1095194 RepID=A0A9P6ID38_9PEZI|nr:FAD binding domain-containing protein [Colletotrichum karsti]KAF9879641.1 FAD binding domain-containing protein [Colletotrichum karsti]
MASFTPLHRLFASLAFAPWAYAASCRSSPGAADWPPAESWARLDESLGGRLLRPAPPGAVCHPGQPVYDVDGCAAAAAGWSERDFHVADPVSVMWDNWSNDTCLPDPAHLCRSGGYSAFVVNATTPEHVKLGVDFARENNVRLNVKSTGHDYLGRSVAPGSLSIWMHHMQDIEYHDGRFQLDGSDVVIEGNAVTVGGGTEMGNVQKAVAEHGQAIVGGGCASVGVGGYTAGGGHSLLSPRYGMAADNVLQMEVVTPKGEILTINEAQNADLFWAMRGGGGSTFGVITSITFSTHPSPSIIHSTWALLIEPEAPYFPDLLAYVLSQWPALEEGGMSMYCTSQSSPMVNPFPIEGLPSQIAGIMGVSLLQDTDRQAMVDLWRPINETISQRWPGATFVQQIEEHPSWISWFDKYQDTRDVGGNTIFASRLLDREALTADVDALAGAVKTVTDKVTRLTTFLVSGKGVHEAVPRGGGNAVLPAWREAYVHAIATTRFPSFNATAKEEAIETLDAAVEGLRQLAPDTGSYLNEGSVYEKDWQKAYWGENYDRLLRIKKDVDPDDVFWCEPCVGSEGWKMVDDGRLCKT